ncbi:hypothetical protein NTJ56_18665 [Burkholderia contaminans]|uniref:hypothetical protein n=1 Tax=Burkholderia contaminans TaxID=488447 RepID=UPI001CF38ED5|nr:hypothetical protein [Burkholderia contaminans]MCA7916138.1 hypothetical protein [Burkholderia contaminans]UUX40471.1 hypothetical protein NTJ56_18665 [Burkholderia contaminans]
MKGISTHLLDVATGRPITGVRIERFDLGEQPPALVARAVSNAEGRKRNGAPMLDGDPAQHHHVPVYRGS